MITSKNMKKLIAEAVGTAILVIGGCGAAVLAGSYIGIFGVAIAFGLSLLLIAYTIGNISGGHVNPAVTIGLALAGKFPKNMVFPYIAAQTVGGLIGATIVYLMNSAKSTANAFAGNVVMPGASFSGAIVTEVIMTAFLVLAVLFTTHHKFSSGFGGVLVGAALALIHIVSIPVTNTSVNPARSVAVAFFQGGQAVSDLWIFISMPIVGAVLAVFLYKAMVSEKE